MSKTIKALNCVYEDCGHPFTTSDAHFYHEESDLCYCSEGCYEAECAKRASAAPAATKPNAPTKPKRAYTKRTTETKERAFGDGSLSLTELNIDTLENIACFLEIEHFIALYLALPKGLWTADALLERRLMQQPAASTMRSTRAAQMFSFIGKIEPQYLTRLCYKKFMRFCIDPIHEEDRVDLIRKMLTDHTKLFHTPGSIRQAKSDFNQFDKVRRSAYLSKALENTWMKTYQTCGGSSTAAASMLDDLTRDVKNPILFGCEKKLTLVQAMSNALGGNKHLITLLLNLSSWRISSVYMNNIYYFYNEENSQVLRNNITNHLKEKYGEFELFIKLVLILTQPWSSDYDYYSSFCEFRPYAIIFDHIGINYKCRENEMKMLEFKASIEIINQRWCEYLSVDHVPKNYSRQRINQLLELTRQKFA